MSHHSCVALFVDGFFGCLGTTLEVFGDSKDPFELSYETTRKSDVIFKPLWQDGAKIGNIKQQNTNVEIKEVSKQKLDVQLRLRECAKDGATQFLADDNSGARVFCYFYKKQYCTTPTGCISKQQQANHSKTKTAQDKYF